MARASGERVKGSTLTAHKVDRVVNAPRENLDESDEGIKQSAEKPETEKLQEETNLRHPKRK